MEELLACCSCSLCTSLRVYMRPELSMQLVVMSGECLACVVVPVSFVPCCGVATNPALPPMWLCAPCLLRLQLIYACAPVSFNNEWLHWSADEARNRLVNEG